MINTGFVMKLNMWILTVNLVLQVMLLPVIQAQKYGRDDSVCVGTPTAPNGVLSKRMPTVSQQFTATIECVIVNKNVTTLIDEYYDGINNRAAVKQLQSGISVQIWMNYNTNQVTTYYPAVTFCETNTIRNSLNAKDFFGYTKTGTGYKIFSAGPMLHMKLPGVTQVYLGTTTYRGIVVDEWKSCQYWDAFDATMIVSWYFNAQTEWDSVIGEAIPIGAHVVGKSYTNLTKSHLFEHYYNFYHFRPKIDPSVFETPAVTCEGRSKYIKPVGLFPISFSLTKEVIDKSNHTISYTKMFYDYKNKLASYLHPSNFGEIRIVHDFQSGVAYVIDSSGGNCTTKEIDLEYYKTPVGQTKVMKDPNAIFGLEDIHPYAYIGARTVRGIQCDAWVATLDNYPAPNISSTVVWYFANREDGLYIEITGDLAEQAGIPMKFTIDAPDVNYHSEYNIFDFSKKDPDWSAFDIGACYINRNRRRFQVSFSGNFAPVVEANKKLFKNYVLMSMSLKLRVSAMRVVNIQVFVEDDIKVQFELLDVPPIMENTSTMQVENSLSRAAAILESAITGKEFFENIADPAYTIFKGMIPVKPLIEITYIVHNSSWTPTQGNTPDHTSGQETTESPTQPTVIVPTKPHGSIPSKDTTLCSSSPPIPTGVKQKSIPKVPVQFSAHIECVIVDKNFTTDLHEYYDELNNRGAVHQLESGSELDAWYDYQSNEFIAYYIPKKKCFVQTLSTSDQRYLFGYTKDGSTGKIFSAGKVLHMIETGITQVYMGIKSYRGIVVDTWQSCQHWDIFNATMNVTWYFTAPTEWDTAVGQVVPVGAYVVGNVWDSATTFRRIQHYYNLFHFRLEIDNPTVFETPAGLQCPGRKNTKLLPTMPNVFSFTSENIDKKRETISFMQEFYDYDSKLVMYNFRPLEVDSNPFGTNMLREIHDFNTGVAYVTDTMRGNCTAKTIELTFDDRSVDRNHVSMRNSAQFFYFDQINYTYEGVKSIRNIDCDSWVGIRANWPSNGVNATWMWYFATDSWTEINTGQKQVGAPVRLTVDSPAAGIHHEYNIYNFARNRPNPLDFDISGCYLKGTRRFQLNFPGDYASIVSNNMISLKYHMLKSLAKQLQLSTLRISKLQVFIDQDIIVTFELLDVSPLVGNVHHIVQQTSLQQASNTLINLIKKNRFVVTLDDPVFKNVAGLIPKQTAFLETTNLKQNSTNSSDDNKGKGSGVMAAVGISMSIVGGVLGCLCSYLWRRHF